MAVRVPRIGLKDDYYPSLGIRTLPNQTNDPGFPGVTPPKTNNPLAPGLRMNPAANEAALRGSRTRVADASGAASAELTQKELNLLAYTLLGEAAGEGREGMEAVMWTIRNRAESGRYPDNPAAVATQKDSRGVHQYSAWNTKKSGGNAPKSRFSTSSPEFKEALEVAQRVMAGEVQDPTGGATHFYAEGSPKPNWFEAEGPAGEVKIGNHRFAARNTAIDAARTAAEATEAMTGGGRFNPRPVAPVVPERRPDTSSESSGSDLTTRTVQTVEINPSTGMPYPRLTPQPSSTSSSREVVRLSQMRSQPANRQDLVGQAARVGETNAAAASKQSRNRDQVGQAARVVTQNRASATKTARAAPPVQPAVQGQNKTPEQIRQEADNARVSGYRDIQEMGPSSRGAKATPQPTQRSGVTKTAGTVTSTGTKLPLAGETQLPRNVTPKVEVPKAPKPVTKFVRPMTQADAVAASGFRLPKLQTPRISTAIIPAPEPAKRLPVGKPLALKDFSTTPQGPSRGRGGKRGGTKTSIQPKEPTMEEVIAVSLPRRRPATPVRQQVAGPLVLANGQIIRGAQPQAQSVAAMIAQQVRSPGYTSTQFQEDRFQFTENTQLPAALDNDRWKTGYETAPKSSNSNPNSSWQWW